MSIAENPARHEQFSDHRAYTEFQVPLATGPDGQVAYWKPERDAHLLITGITGSGKTGALNGIIQEHADAGWHTWLIDGKRIDLSGNRHHPNIEHLAQDSDSQTQLLKLAHDTMKMRYELVRDRKMSTAEFTPIALVINEWGEFLNQVSTPATKAKDNTAGYYAQEWLSTLLRLGRTAKIHVVINDNDLFMTLLESGEVRSNFGAKLTYGAMHSTVGAAMMWGAQNIDLVRQYPRPGSGIALIDGVPTQVQVIHTPAPDAPPAQDH